MFNPGGSSPVGSSGMREVSAIEALIEALGTDAYNRKQHLLGVILTIVDASFPDKEQREAVKSLVKNAIYNEDTDNYEIVNQWVVKFGKSDLYPSKGFDNHKLDQPRPFYF